MSSFDKFCGGPFWNLTLTWEGSAPRFTECFQDSVLVWGPCAWLCLLSVPYGLYLAHSPSHPIRKNRFNVTKVVLAVLLLLTELAALIKNIIGYKSEDDVPAIKIVTPIIMVVSLFISVLVIRVERRKGFITSGVLFIFWLLLVLCGVIPFYMKILTAQDQGGVPDMFEYIVFYTYYGLLLLQFFVFCFADNLPPDLQPGAGKKPSPEIAASFLSRITFWWMTGLVLLGYKKDLSAEDLFELNPRDTTDSTSPALERAWRKEVEACKRKNRARSDDSRSHGSSREAMHEKTPLLSGQTSQEQGSAGGKKLKTPSLVWCFAKVYGPTLLTAHACKVVCDVLTFVGPTLQEQLIGYTESLSSGSASMQKWKGYLFAVLFFVSAVLNSFFFHQLFHIGMTLGMRIKSALIAAIYKKALVMSNEARKTTTVGEIVNLMSVDAQRMQDVTGYLWMLWSAPFQIVLAVYLLWQQLGPSVLAGLAVMILLIPVNGVMATFQRKYQMTQMTQKDKRIKLMSEILNGIKVLKLYAWELSFQDKVNAIRNVELDTLRKYAYLSAVGTFTWTCAPLIVLLASLTTFVLTGNQLTATNAFVSLSLFNILRFPMNLLPMMVTYLVTASVSVRRLSKFLQNEDIDFTNVQHNPSSEEVVLVENGDFAWGKQPDDPVTLKRLNLTVQTGQLVAIVGQVGAGKSSILSAILGEMEKINGRVNVKGSVAYVAQQAWIQNCTLKDNILFGKDNDDDMYDKCLDACALKPDLEILPGGDQTEIGEKGINLSGGQKQRVSLARAVYSQADLYLLDDPLSAVDSHVGKHIFEQVVGENGLLAGKTRVLVTHGIQWLPMVDKIFVVVNGEISEQGSYDELLSYEGAFAQFLKSYFIEEAEKEDSDTEEEDPEVKVSKQKILERLSSVTEVEDIRKISGAESDHKSTSEHKSGAGSRKLSRHLSRQKSTKASSIDEKKPVEPPKPADKIIEEEKQEQGKVKMTVYFSYLYSMGVVPTLTWLAFFLLYQGASVGSNVWLSKWTDDPIIINGTNAPNYESKSNMYLGIYGVLGATQAVFVLIYAMVTAFSLVRASRLLHFGMLANILRSPMSFFDTTPIGRILNRFSRDIETIDNVLPALIRSWLNTFFGVISTLVVISYSTPLFLSVVIPLFILYYFIQRFYVPTSRQLKRIESTTRSPIYVHFSETVTGASTIRAYGAQQRFIQTSENTVDHNLVFYFAQIASNRWLGFRLELLGSLVVLAAALFSVVPSEPLAAGLVGLSISYALQVTQGLNWMVRMTSDLETNIVSVERVKEYSETASEAEWYIQPGPPRTWPDQGNVAFESYSTRYRAGLDLVLRGITAHVKGGEKVGIVGRTGAGKSSLTLALFRLVEAAGGSIIIDGIDISQLGLHQLRSKVTILPQDPVLFSGTLRMNLDPFDKYTDAQLWGALEQAHLKSFVSGLAAQLEYECGEGGQNLSVGQRQLVCLARTLLRKTKILILDEATAAVDLETDELIQKTIQQEFEDCTILTIAHRLNTVMECNKIMVLDVGKIAEYDSPEALLDNKRSKFYAMAKDAKLV